MRPLAKIGLVVAGYGVAFAIASGAVALHVMVTSGSDRQSSGGMYAFGDSLLFLAVFGVAAVPATGAALFFLRPYRSFWLVFSVVALALALTGLAALIIYITAQTADVRSVARAWSGAAVLRILLAPLFALAFLLIGLFAPSRSFRITLFVATAMETIAFSCVALMWFHPWRAFY